MREQFCEVAVKLYEKFVKTQVDSVGNNPFHDTENKEVIKAYHLGIVKGTAKDKFSPNDLITREQLKEFHRQRYFLILGKRSY